MQLVTTFNQKILKKELLDLAQSCTVPIKFTKINALKSLQRR